MASGRSFAGQDGSIGLGLLLLMTVAFVAGEARESGHGSHADLPGHPRAPARGAGAVIFDTAPEGTETETRGAIRELRLRPPWFGDAAKFDWAPDEELIRDAGRNGF